ncbi:sugar ABC transporter substrate-binding protein [Defluviimonas sp. 20V17]|uniref:Polysaccharide export outer membrane protein n=1 Tax=Allgaiera indica TaxID=765699 RepID=A0AAN4USZ8_9RHOB|nr:polysaccharide biosynthesis/export family protein [Allgaiera indica]KDB02223.1 sugar ABC transporter substrate-binding protein [Defluviimonas sp. 20V17]GHE02706.1 sugar ABC transporter substrate-binding protein [Allgaiera indica]SDX18915.1 polysaccharide export outer membrane protein [Allgaiera indica]
MKIISLSGARVLALFALVTVLAGCALPRPGPDKAEIYAGSVQRKGDAFIVAVNDRVTRATSVTPALGFSNSFKHAGLVGSDIIHPGDKLGVSVYENVTDPLLGAPGQKVSQLAEIKVDGAGYIFVPYAGRIKAAGLSVEALRQAITRKLDTQTPDPQVSVIRAPGDGATVTVEGSVTGQGVYPIDRSTRTLAAMIAKAGGVNIPNDVALVSVTRGHKVGEIWLNDLYENPSLDIALRPGDRITVTKDSRAFTALGATGVQTRVPFTSNTMSAIEAIAQVGGLNPLLADPTGVFIYRNEPAAIANAVLGRHDLVGPQRMIYVLDLTKPMGMFEARDFLIRNGDTLYVTQAPFAQWQKVLSAFSGTVGTVGNIARVKSATGF